MVVTGNVFKHLIFGGVSSADYGIYITGEAVYNAPTRAVEMVSVPGRNGDVPIDMGHWNNIEVKYTAGTYAKTQAEFAEAVSAFRNAILPLMGYQRLEDTYNPNEYRLGIFTAGLDIEPSSKSKAGEFQITFNCKPQRWLKSGEAEITVSDGDTITNPTGYDSQPLLQIDGNGTINIGDSQVTINDAPIGSVTLADSVSRDDVWSANARAKTYTTVIDFTNLSQMLAIGDSFKIGSISQMETLAPFYDSSNGYATATIITAPTNGTASITPIVNGKRTASVEWTGFDFIYGTSQSYSDNMVMRSTWGHAPTSGTQTWAIVVDYDGSTTITITFTTTGSAPPNYFAGSWVIPCSFVVSSIIGESSIPAYSGDVFIDMEIGDAYTIEGGTYISLNKYIQLGAQLPTLKPGANNITYDDTITSLKITPRWWIL